jgi:hypothetical protein
LFVVPLDKYVIRARLYPALIAAVPVFLLGVLAVPEYRLLSIIGLVAGTGLLFLLATIVRTLGRSSERRLVSRWGGMPTTRLLRYSDATNLSLLERRRAALERILGYPLPNADSEARDSSAADDEYTAATRHLVSVVRRHAELCPRVQDENINYGFLRNLLGLKPIAFGVLAAVYLADIYFVGWFPSAAAAYASLCINGAMTLVWAFYVRPRRVFEAANIYAERLFECVTASTDLLATGANKSAARRRRS